MANTIEQVLSELDRWYNELPGGTERPRLLSKLAVLELCGWVEQRFDSIAHDIAKSAGVDGEQTVVERIAKTYGFDYGSHVRGVFLSIGGEVLMRKAENSLDTSGQGDLDRLRTMLGSLWKQRCELAHSSSDSTLGQLPSINAPSWTINQQRILAKLIVKLETELRGAI